MNDSFCYTSIQQRSPLRQSVALDSVIAIGHLSLQIPPKCSHFTSDKNSEKKRIYKQIFTSQTPNSRPKQQTCLESGQEPVASLELTQTSGFSQLYGQGFSFSPTIK